MRKRRRCEMKEFSEEDKASIRYIQDKMRSVACVAAAAIVEPQDEVSKVHANMADTMIGLLVKGLGKKEKKLIEARIKAHALKVSRVEL